MFACMLTAQHNGALKMTKTLRNVYKWMPTKIDTVIEMKNSFICKLNNFGYSWTVSSQYEIPINSCYICNTIFVLINVQLLALHTIWDAA